MKGHHVAVLIGADHWGLEWRWTCHEPDTAPCRTMCVRSSCEEGCVCGDPDIMPLSYCNLVITFQEDDATPEETYRGPVTPVRSGEIEVTWEGEGYVWRYAESPQADTGDSVLDLPESTG